MCFVHCEHYHWWFDYVHFVEDLADHPMVSELGPDFMSLALDGFQALLRGCRGGIVSFFLNQKRIAGIGNIYGQVPSARRACVCCGASTP